MLLITDGSVEENSSVSEDKKTDIAEINLLNNLYFSDNSDTRGISEIYDSVQYQKTNKVKLL